MSPRGCLSPGGTDRPASPRVPWVSRTRRRGQVLSQRSVPSSYYVRGSYYARGPYALLKTQLRPSGSLQMWKEKRHLGA